MIIQALLAFSCLSLASYAQRGVGRIIRNQGHRHPTAIPRPQGTNANLPQPVEPDPFEIFLRARKEDLPSSLRFIEHLEHGLKPSYVAIFSGGDKVERRLKGFGKKSADSLQAFAKTHGYKLVFLDELQYNKLLTFKFKQFHPAWSRVFAFPALKRAFPNAKYYVWFDDDILVPHPETYMLNHYINMMESDPEWHVLIANEPPPNLLNSGLLIMKNTELSSLLLEQAKLYGASSRFFRDFGWEQEAIKVVRSMMDWEDQIRLVPHRHDGIYNINTFAVNQPKYDPEIQAEFGDAFVHFCGLTPSVRETMMAEWIERVNSWRLEIKQRYNL